MSAGENTGGYDTRIAASRFLFNLTALNQFAVRNSRIENNQNITILDLNNTSRSGKYSTLNPISVVFENMTISNNTGGSVEGSGGLLSISSSKIPLQITIRNSQFADNTIISKGKFRVIFG